MSKIISLTTENVKKISVVQITPDGNLVTIGGGNGMGKSSVLDSIEYALAGGDHIPSKPVRRGEDKAKVVLDLGDIIVRRTFTAAGGTSLVITNADGVPQKSPQAILDALTGKLSFDPLAFCNQDGKDQAATLSKLMGLDFKEQDAEIARLYEERKVVNRDVASLKAQGQAQAEYPEFAGQEQISPSEIFAEQAKAGEMNAANEKFRASAQKCQEDLASAIVGLNESLTIIHEMDRKLVEARNQFKERQAAVEKRQPEVKEMAEKAAALVDIPMGPFSEKVKTTEDRNSKIRANAAKKKLRDDYKAKNAESEKLTGKIDALEKEKRTKIQDSKFPVPGLSLSDTREVLFDGLPFSQSNTAKQLEVSVAVGLAMNTKLRILLIRRGSDLDPASLKLVADLAAKADAQVWLETSRTDVPVSVVMEDGHVQGVTEKEAE